MTISQQQISLASDEGNSLIGLHRFSHEAMATAFEIFIRHEDSSYARGAAVEAFQLLDRLEQQLSRFVENSSVCRINNLAVGRPLTLDPDTWACLRLAIAISTETNGVFDITIGTLMNCWLDEDKSKRQPLPEQLKLAQQQTGGHNLRLDESRHTVELLRTPLKIDLGGIGKGYAIDQMGQLLREWSINTALIQGGGSSVLALGRPSDTKGWPVTLSSAPQAENTVGRLYLVDRALSSSGLRQGPHIIDPRDGILLKNQRATWCWAAGAGRADGLATAFMVMSTEQVQQYCTQHPEVSAMISEQEKDREKISYFGLAQDGQFHAS